MRLVAWRRVEPSGTLRGFATVRLPIGLVIVDCPVHRGSRGPWAALPGRPVIDDNGRHAADPQRPNKRRWAAMGYWIDRDLTDRGSTAVVKLVRNADPEALR
jgi:DNA-binding cell septation regulator SpoVG